MIKTKVNIAFLLRGRYKSAELWLNQEVHWYSYQFH